MVLVREDLDLLTKQVVQHDMDCTTLGECIRNRSCVSKRVRKDAKLRLMIAGFRFLGSPYDVDM